MRMHAAVRSVRLCFAVLAILVLSATLFGQSQFGQINGTVTDPQGAAVPNANVTATNVGTGIAVPATTNNLGFYSVKELLPGTYSVKVTAPSFQTAVVRTVVVNVGQITRQDVKLAIGATSQTVEVTETAPTVNTEEGKLSSTVSGDVIANMPLNGRNVYDLIQFNPGAVSVAGVDFENGAGVVVNGARENFNGFLINGVSNKDLSGGAAHQPIADTVQEFQVLTLNTSAQYGNSAGAITTIVTKSGTNSFHGSAWEFNRNDAYDATDFYVNHTADPTQRKKPALRFNQFGGTLGGPIVKEKVFFFGAYQGERFRTTPPPSEALIESPQWRQAVQSALPNSVAALLYKNFAPQAPQTSTAGDLASYVAGGSSGSGIPTVAGYVCPDNSNVAMATSMARVIGYTPGVDDAGCSDPLSAHGVGRLAGTFPRTGVPFQVNVVNLKPSQTQGNLLNGNEASMRLDFDPNVNNRIFTEFDWFRQTDSLNAGAAGVRGFRDPIHFITPNAQVNFVHTFSSRVINEFRAGYASTVEPIRPNLPGVPSVGFDDGSIGFGSYNGFPQNFKDHIYTFSDMVSISHGNHNMKLGLDARRNMENSEFNVGRPSYYMFDALFFAADAPYGEVAGVNPELLSGAASHLSSNIRHFRNLEYGAYFNDDWKVTPKLTLNLGLRYDLYGRHHEGSNLGTTFILGPGSNIIDNITTGAGQMRDANKPAGSAGCTTAAQIKTAVLAGVCGPGGFAPSKTLGKGRYKDLGPRIGFAYDVFGDGKTSFRGGAGVSYEGTFYNAESNSRWNPPYYSFNSVFNFLGGGTGAVVYGPQSGSAPRYTGGPDPLNFQGSGSTAIGNIMGWAPNNPNQAILTGIIFPKGIDDPYMYNGFLGVQHETFGHNVIEVDYVGTMGHKLFRSEDINRIPGGALPAGTCTTDIFGRQLCSQRNKTVGSTGLALNPLGRLNPNYGRLRTWENVVNSNYNGLQVALRHSVSRTVQYAVNYTWSHSIDGGSTWHSGATTANGPAAGEGFTSDQTMPWLDRGNSIYDIRHRITGTLVFNLPFFRSQQGFLGHILGGWQFNDLLSFQTGAHWSPFCNSGSSAGGACDYNKDDVRNDRPNSDIKGFDGATHNMWADGWTGFAKQHFSTPPAGSPGNLGRNTFVGPKFFDTDMSLFKNFKITERVRMQFRGETFNTLNHTNFELPGNQGYNNIKSSKFGEAGGAFSPRNIQLGLKLEF